MRPVMQVVEIVGFNLQNVRDVVNHVIRQFENRFSSFRFFGLFYHLLFLSDAFHFDF